MVYLPNGPNPSISDILHDHVASLQKDKPQSAIIVLGDFNDPSFALNDFSQYVTCTTRLDNTLDLCFSNIANAYNTCYKRDPLGISDHHCVLLRPSYIPKLKREKSIVKTIKIDKGEQCEQLQDCFDSTDWDIFYKSCDNTDELTDTISDYVSFCDSVTTKTKKVKIFSNNKPWLDKNLKQKLVQKRKFISSGNRLELKLLQKQLDTEIQTCRQKYKRKLEDNFSKNNSKQAWQGLQHITGYKLKSPTLQKSNDTDKLCNDLNHFYNRFNDDSDIDKIKCTLKELTDLSNSNNDSLNVEEKQVLEQFLKLNSKKAAGPDHIAPYILKSCAHQLAPVYTRLFNKCSSDHIPVLWKTSTIIPVPKHNKPQELNDYRPVALTSVAFKSFERIILSTPSLC